VKDSSTQADTLAMLEIGFYGDAIRIKPNAVERETVRGLDCDPHFAKCGDRIGHEAFPAGLIDRRLRTISYGDGESLVPQLDCGGQTRGTASHDKYICVWLRIETLR
jgi:hypothetical protein